MDSNYYTIPCSFVLEEDVSKQTFFNSNEPRFRHKNACKSTTWLPQIKSFFKNIILLKSKP